MRERERKLRCHGFVQVGCLLFSFHSLIYKALSLSLSLHPTTHALLPFFLFFPQQRIKKSKVLWDNLFIFTFTTVSDLNILLWKSWIFLAISQVVGPKVLLMLEYAKFTQSWLQVSGIVLFHETSARPTTHLYRRASKVPLLYMICIQIRRWLSRFLHHQNLSFICSDIGVSENHASATGSSFQINTF